MSHAIHFLAPHHTQIVACGRARLTVLSVREIGAVTCRNCLRAHRQGWHGTRAPKQKARVA